MATYHILNLHHLVFVVFVTIFLTSINPSFSATGIVSKVCKQTPNYTYCVRALYSDPRTPNDDSYFLAYISFGLAYTNASNTRDHISQLLSSPRLGDVTALLNKLHVCTGHYDKAISAIERAYNDLNSETFSELGTYSNVVGRGADDCESAFRGSRHSGLLTVRNSDLKHLSQICYAVYKLFT